MKKKNQHTISDVLSNFGFVYEVFKAIAHAVMARGGTMEHLRRIVNEPALVERIAHLIVPFSSTSELPLTDGEYRVYVDYSMPRDKAALEAEFSVGGVSKLFYGDYKWRLHALCVGVDQTPGERIMLVKRFDRETESEANIAEMDKLGYRPATHLEAYAFARANPELQRQFRIVALGSFAKVHCSRRIAAVLDNGACGRGFGDYDFDDGWVHYTRFLFVRK